jgi:hypothetical protein
MTEFDESYWPDIVCPDGVWDLEQVKKELLDYSDMMHEVTRAYIHVSAGRISKPNTAAYHVIAFFDVQMSEEYDRGYADGKEDATEEGCVG